MNPVIVFILIGIVVILVFAVRVYKQTDDLPLSLVIAFLSSVVLFFIMAVTADSFAFQNKGATITKTESIEVNAITLGENYKDNYIPVVSKLPNGEEITTLAPKSDYDTVSFIDKETGKLETFDSGEGNFIVGNKESVTVTYMELTEKSNWYFIYGDSKNIINYTVTIKEEE